MVGQVLWVNTKATELELALSNLFCLVFCVSPVFCFPKLGVTVALKQSGVCTALMEKRVSYEKWLKTCPFSPGLTGYPVTPESRSSTRNPLVLLSHEQAGGWNLSWWNLRLLPAAYGHGNGRRAMGGRGKSKYFKILWRKIRVSVSLKRGKGVSDTEKAILFLFAFCQFYMTLGKSRDCCL